MLTLRGLRILLVNKNNYADKVYFTFSLITMMHLFTLSGDFKQRDVKLLNLYSILVDFFVNKTIYYFK